MEKLKQMKECLTGIVEGQIYGNIDKVNAEELGEVVDMIKDLAETIYYCTVTEAMEGQEKEEKMYYSPMMYNDGSMYYDPRYRERYNSGVMYAQNGGGRGGNSSSNSGSGGNNARGGGSRGYSDGNYTMYNDGMYPVYPMDMSHVYRDGMMKDPREGKSGMRRKMYMEGKSHHDKTKQMQELDAYMQELASDMTEMIQDASPEEKQLLQNKIQTLAQKLK